ncbi:retrovirus-related pol polyprotein from transposon TNT 1-94 [Tanacetum coccineum]
MTGDRSRLKNFVKKFIGTVRFENDHFGAIMGYGDYVIGDSVISRVYYVEGLGHNLFFVGQFCDSDLEVAFRKHSCYVRDTDGVELIKASKNKSWLWHRRLNHLNFGTINDLARKDLVRGLPRLKFEKDHLCSACQLGKSKKHTHKPKTWEKHQFGVPNSLHGIYFLRSKDETPAVIIKFLEQIPVGLNKTVRFIRTDNGTEFVNKTLRNRTLVEAARTMLIFSKAPMFLWAEAVATTCYTQNRSLIHIRHDKTPYELVHNKKPDLTFFRVFSALCYPTNDNENLGKLQPRTDIGIFIRYAPSRKDKFRARTKSDSCNTLCTLTNKDLEILFHPMFDECMEPPHVERPVSPAPAIPAPINSAGVAAEPTIIEANPFAPVDNNPFVNVFAPEHSSEATSSGDVSST